MGLHKLKVLWVVVAVLACFPANEAHALFEVRGIYGFNFINPASVSTSIPAFTDMTAFGADAIVMLPLFPIGFGIRYESFSSSKAATIGLISSTVKTSLTRLALLANFRIIDTGIYLGAIGTIGLSHSAKYQLTATGFPDLGELTSSSISTTSFGVEGGLHLMGLLVGGEGGYMMGKSKSFESGGTVQTIGGNNIEVDYGGLYVRLHLGYSF